MYKELRLSYLIAHRKNANYQIDEIIIMNDDKCSSFSEEGFT